MINETVKKAGIKPLGRTKMSIKVKIKRLECQILLLEQKLEGISNNAKPLVKKAIQKRKEALKYLDKLTYNDNPRWHILCKKFNFTHHAV